MRHAAQLERARLLSPRQYIQSVCAAMSVPSDDVVSVDIDVRADDDVVMVEIRFLARENILPVIEEAVRNSGE
jgi:hypothetical protein